MVCRLALKLIPSGMNCLKIPSDVEHHLLFEKAML